MQFSQDSFKARIKVPRAVPFRSVAADPARRISTSTPMSGIAVLDFVRRWWSIFLRRAPELLSEGSACLICGIRQFISRFYLSRFLSRIIPVEKCCARWSRAGNSFYLFISKNFSRRVYFSHVPSQIIRLNIHLFFSLFLNKFHGNRANAPRSSCSRVHVCRLLSRAISFPLWASDVSPLAVPHRYLHIETANTPRIRLNNASQPARLIQK